MEQYCYRFGGSNADGDASMAAKLGTKGANLAEMSRIGLPVPPGFTVSIDVCAHFLRKGKFPHGFFEEVCRSLEDLEAATGRGWGDPSRPLLLSLRSGGARPMPGVMDTVLNMGLNEATTRGLAELNGEEFAEACRAKLEATYRAVVGGPRGAVPGAVEEQLWEAMAALFRGWTSPRTRAYRRLHGLQDARGTALTCQAMVFGNLDEHSASGVAFSRHPVTGYPRLYGEYLVQAQGDQVMLGRRRLRQVSGGEEGQGETLEERFPDAFQELAWALDRLEGHFQDLQRVEFSLEAGTLWLLQSDRAQRSGEAALRSALEMMDEGLIDEEEAVLRVEPQRHLRELLAPRVDIDRSPREPIARGEPCAAGAVTGRLVMTAGEALNRARRGESVILFVEQPRVDDIALLEAVKGVVSTRMGLCTHAAELARQAGVVSVVGVTGVRLRVDGSGVVVGNHFLSRGELVTLDGTGGALYEGALSLVRDPVDQGRLGRFLAITDLHRRMEIRVAGADRVQLARGLAAGAHGAGLIATEALFDRHPQAMMAMRAALIADDEEQRRVALQELVECHRQWFVHLLRILRGAPAMVRLLACGPSYFLPHNDVTTAATANHLGMSEGEVRRRGASLKDDEPGLGLRGGQFALGMPRLWEMQVQALVEAARVVLEEEGVGSTVELGLPGLLGGRDTARLIDDVEQTIADHLYGAATAISIEVGPIIDTPRAALRAASLAHQAERIWIDTDHLTRLCWGLSREAATSLVELGGHRSVSMDDPFSTIDRSGVGELVIHAVQRIRRRRSDLAVGVVGPHGAEPGSSRFLESLAVDHITVEAGQVVAARIAAAQASVQRRALGRRGQLIL